MNRTMTLIEVRKSILVCDDNQDVLDFLEQFLNEAGYEVRTTHGYVEINLRMKQGAVAALATSLPKLPRYKFPSGDLLSWLESLGRARVMRSPIRATQIKTRSSTRSSA